MRTTLRNLPVMLAIFAVFSCGDSVTEPLTEDEELYRGVIPTAAVTADGVAGSGEWTGIGVIAADSTGDSEGSANSDLTSFYIARSDSEIFFRIDVDGTASLPPTQPNTENGTTGFTVRFRLFNQAAIGCSEVEEGGDSLWVFTAEATSDGTIDAAVTTFDLHSGGTESVSVGAGQILELALPTSVIIAEYTRIKVFGVESFWDDQVPVDQGGPVRGSYDTHWDVPFCMTLG